MSRFADPQCITKDGQNLTFKTRGGTDLAAIAKTEELLTEAKTVLRSAINAIGATPLSPAIKKWAEIYFLTGKSGPSSSEIRHIRKVLNDTLLGLSGDMTLKIGAVVSRSETAGVLGSVAMIKYNKGDTLKAHNTVVKELGPRKFWQKAKMEKAGAIKLQDSAMLGPLGLVTLIHEATHKYAGTIDYSYFDDDDGETPTDTFTNKAKALANADSFGYFAIRAAGG